MDRANEDTSEQQREDLRQEELLSNSFGALADGINRAEHGSFADFSGGMGWKCTVIILVALIEGLHIWRWFSGS